jgi:hypothetical protein
MTYVQNPARDAVWRTGETVTPRDPVRGQVNVDFFRRPESAGQPLPQ